MIQLPTRHETLFTILNTNVTQDLKLTWCGAVGSVKAKLALGLAIPVAKAVFASGTTVFSRARRVTIRGAGEYADSECTCDQKRSQEHDAGCAHIG